MQKINIIDTKKGVEDLISYLQDKDYIAFDTETTGLSVDAHIIGLCICAEANIGYYIITKFWDVESQSIVTLETHELAETLCREIKSHPLVMHNAVFDCSMVNNNYGVQLIDSVHTDTMILAHLLDENRRVGLKELGAAFYGASAKKEQEEMKESVIKNGGSLTKDLYELYKGDPYLIGEYGAKDAILTYNLFFEMVPELYEEKLDKFFYEEESMPLLRGPTYELNTIGLKVDQDRIKKLRKELEIEIMELKSFIYKEIHLDVKDKYPATNKKNEFNIGSYQQLSWLLFDKLGNLFPKVSDAGRELSKALGLRTPYNNRDKRIFIDEVKSKKGFQWRDSGEVWDKSARKYKGKAVVRDYWTYLSTDKTVLASLENKYKWVEKLIIYKKLTKLLNTYVDGIQEKCQYGIIRPSFLQHGTTSGRYSSRGPNFQNLPRDDKRVKSCIVARPGKTFVGADQAQLEPRVFSSYSGDSRLQNCFSSGDDFYSVLGTETFDKRGLSLKKDDENSFAKKYPDLRQTSKVVGLSATYGNTANKMAPTLGKSIEEAQEIIDRYFERFPSVYKMALGFHDQVKKTGKVTTIFGRVRRIPKAMEIPELFGDTQHKDLPYEYRNLLNLAVNHPIQSTGASIMNRAAIAFYRACKALGAQDSRWLDVHVVLQVHDELVAECNVEIAQDVAIVLKDCMENTTVLPGVSLLAEPKIANDLALLK